MNRQTLAARICSAALTSVFTVLLLGLALLWMSNDEPVEEDDFTTIISCREVLLKPGNFSEAAVDECREKFNNTVSTTPKTEI